MAQTCDRIGGGGPACGNESGGADDHRDEQDGRGKGYGIGRRHSV